MTRPEAGKLDPGELRAQTNGPKAPPKPESAAKPAATTPKPDQKPTATARPAATKPESAAKPAATTPKPDARPAAAAPTEAPKPAALAVPSQRIHPSTRYLARLAGEAVAVDLEWAAKWAVALRGGVPVEAVAQYRANQEALTDAAKIEEDIHLNLKNLLEVRRHFKGEVDKVTKLIKKLPAEAYEGHDITSKAMAERRRIELVEMLQELEEDEENIQAHIRKQLANAADADAYREACLEASDELALLGVNYPVYLDSARDLAAGLRRIERFHEKDAKRDAA